MKKICFIVCLSLTVLTIRAQEFEGIESGDKELSFNGFLFTNVGSEYGMTSGNIFVSYGSYITDKLLVGIAPGVSLSSYMGEITADFSGQLYGNFNFTSKHRTIPYVRGSYYQQSFDTEYATLFELAYIQGGIGFKYFFNERLAWDTTVTYGLSLGNVEIGNLMLLTGLSIVW